MAQTKGTEGSSRSILPFLERLWNGGETDIKLIFNLRQKKGLDEKAIQGGTVREKIPKAGSSKVLSARGCSEFQQCKTS